MTFSARVTPRVAVVVGLGCAVLLAGCSGSPARPPAPATTVAATTASAAAPTPTDTPSATPPVVPTATVPSPGATLASLTSGQSAQLNDAGGFTIETPDESSGGYSSPSDSTDTPSTGGLTAYAVDGSALGSVPSASYSSECGFLDAGSGGQRVLLTETVTVVPAAGVVPPNTTVALSAWDPSTGTQRWSTTLAASATGTGDCLSPDGASTLGGVVTTVDGAWAAVEHLDQNDVSATVVDVVDLATGKAHRDQQVSGIVGNWLVYHNSGVSPNTNTFADPATGNPLGTLAEGETTATGVNLPFDSDRLGVMPVGGLDPSQGYAGFASLMPDASTLLVNLDDTNSDQPQTITAYQLPTGKPRWTRSAPAGHRWTVLASGGDHLLIDDAVTTVAPGSGEETTTDALVAWGLSNGAQTWTSSEAQVCALTSSQVQVQVNDQLATLAMATGVQESFQASDYTCSATTRTGVRDEDDVVTQVLTP